MKSAKLPVAETSSHRRSQPVRQARTNPSRTTGPLSRAGGDPDAPAGDQPIDIFPAITHFTDTISALPKELVRHFTLLKEVDAKIYGPEAELFKLVTAAAETPSSSLQPNVDKINGVATTSTTVPAQDIVHNNIHAQVATAATSSNPDTGTVDYSNIPRPHLLRQATIKLHELLGSLEEKNHVLATANEALYKQTARIDDVWPYLEDEFSDEVKWGSSTHWAYPENRNGKNSQAERTRRDGAAVISAAAQALADEVAARSDARKQAVQAKKTAKNNQLDSELDDQDGKGKEGGKKGKARKTAEAGVGLGISAATPNGTAQPKKRKNEKTANGGTAMAATLSSQGTSKGKTSSPRATPAPDGPKKRKALPTGNSQAKKTKTSGTMSPSLVTSPVVPPLPEPKTTTTASPAPSATPRQPSSRSRQNSLSTAAMDNGKAKLPSAAAAKTNGRTPVPNAATPKASPQPTTEPKAAEKPSAPIKTEKKDTERSESTTPALPASSKKDVKPEETGRKNEPTPPVPVMPTVTTKSGRASKPSTPALATFQEAARSRPSRESTGSKKGHKKSNSTVQAPPPRVLEEDTASSAPGEDEDVDVDADEPRYCYCEGVSYGEMVACDSDDCTREWFHLGCVGLKVAPGSKTKWYCEDCKERLKKQRSNGRS